MYSENTFAPEYTKVVNDKNALTQALLESKFQYSVSNIQSSKDVGVNADYTIRYGTEASVPITRFGMENYTKMLGIPNVFAARIPGDLLERNVARLGAEYEKPVKVIRRESDGAIVNVVGPDFAQVKTMDVLNRISEDFVSGPKTRPSTVSTTGINLYFDMPTELTVEPKVGDVIKFGRQVFNSEIGTGKLTAAQFLYRLVCSNGATTTSDFGRVNMPRAKNLSGDELLDAFINNYNTMFPNADTMGAIFRAMVNEKVFTDDLLNYYKYLSKTLLNPGLGHFLGHDVRSDEAVNSFKDLFSIKDVDFVELENERKENMRKVRENPEFTVPRRRVDDLTYYDVYNKVTALPHNFRRDMKRSSAVENLGGGILRHVRETFVEKEPTLVIADGPTDEE